MRLAAFRSACAALLAAGALLYPAAARAQDQPRRDWEPRGFDFTADGVWRVRARAVARLRAAALARGDFASLNAAVRSAANLVQLGAPVTAPLAVSGVLRVPVFLVHYRNTDPASLRTAAEYYDALLAASPTLGRPFTIRTFYEQMSNGLLSVQGVIAGWVVLDSSDTWYEGGRNGLDGTGHVARMISEAVGKSDASLDFGQFDNDGPDGIPNSGDDDGFVDMAVLVHPEQDGACGSNANIWSHRHYYSAWTGLTLATNDTSGKPGFGVLRVNNYTIQSGVGGATACDATQIMAPGTAAHETGHGLGLPDFYDTNPNDGDDSEGIGHWGLMGSGNYAKPPSPAHLEGFSRLELGWVAVRDLTADGTYSFGPYTVSDTIFRIVPSGPNSRNEYFLLENRQATLGDTALIQTKGPGLLIWHVDMMQYATCALPANCVNTGPIHGLALAQADGLDNLRSSTPGVRNRGDAGDPYPGSTGNTTFSFTSNPSATLNANGAYVGFVIDSIRQVVPNGELAFRLRFGGLTLVRASDTTAQVRVRGATYRLYQNLVTASDTATISIDSTQTGPDGRTRFTFASWSDGGARTHAITMTATGATYTAQVSRAFRVITAVTGLSSPPPGLLLDTFRLEGDSVVLDAPVPPLTIFEGWTGDTNTAQPRLVLRMNRPYTLAAGFVPVVLDSVVAALEGGGGIGPIARTVLDEQGNRNGRFDLGDFVAWLDRSGAAVDAATLARIRRRAR